VANDIGNGFGQYRRLILKELERLNEAYESLRKTLEDVRRDDLPGMRQEFKDELQEVKADILADVKPNPVVQAAKITGTWQFYAVVLSSATAVIVAIIALLQSN
jgi:archaellum component FlaC